MIISLEISITWEFHIENQNLNIATRSTCIFLKCLILACRNSLRHFDWLFIFCKIKKMFLFDKWYFDRKIQFKNDCEFEIRYSSLSAPKCIFIFFRVFCVNFISSKIQINKLNLYMIILSLRQKKTNDTFSSDNACYLYTIFPDVINPSDAKCVMWEKRAYSSFISKTFLDSFDLSFKYFQIRFCRISERISFSKI
jgi:hypothetical protein